MTERVLSAGQPKPGRHSIARCWRIFAPILKAGELGSPFAGRSRSTTRACPPVSSALAVQNVHIEPDTMVADITFGGTRGWASAEWLEKRGLAVRSLPYRHKWRDGSYRTELPL